MDRADHDVLDLVPCGVRDRFSVIDASLAHLGLDVLKVVVVLALEVVGVEGLARLSGNLTGSSLKQEARVDSAYRPERVEQYVDRVAVGVLVYFLRAEDLGDDALSASESGELVADLSRLNGLDVYLDELAVTYDVGNLTVHVLIPRSGDVRVRRGQNLTVQVTQLRLGQGDLPQSGDQDVTLGDLLALLDDTLAVVALGVVTAQLLQVLREVGHVGLDARGDVAAQLDAVLSLVDR